MNVPDWLWQMLPKSWLLALVIIIVVGYAIKQAIEASDAIAGLFGKMGQKMRERAVKRHSPYYTVLAKELQDIRDYMEQMEVNQEITQAYLVMDAQWHNKVDVSLAEKGALSVLPARVPFTEFSRKWREENWRPSLAA